MNKLKVLASLITAAFVAVADEPSGEYVSQLGYYAGQYTYAQYSNFIGAYSGYDTWGLTKTDLYGVNSGKYAYSLDRCIGVGFWALASAGYDYDTIAIGSSAARDSYEVYRSVFIGVGSGRNSRYVYDSVFIGDGLGADLTDGVTGRTEVNGQIYVDKNSDTFWIRTGNEDRDFGGLMYRSGTLTVDGHAVYSAARDPHVRADFYLREDGDDSKDGRSYANAKATIKGVIDAANALTNKAELSVAVSAGDYVPPYLDFGSSNLLVFTACDGKERTRVVGGTNSVCAIASHYCEWDGFTFAGFVGVGARYDNTYIPRFANMIFYECKFVGTDYLTEYGYAAVNSCDMIGCYIGRSRYETRGNWGNRSKGIIYRNVYFEDCVIDGMDLFEQGGGPYTHYYILMYEIDAYNSLFKLPGTVSTGDHYRYDHVTIHAPSVYCVPVEKVSGSYTNPFPNNTNHVSNCFYIIDNATPDYIQPVRGQPIPTNSPGVFVCTYAANVDRNYVALDENVVSVRDDGEFDYGWKNSGRGFTKTLKRIMDRGPMVLSAPRSAPLRSPSVPDEEGDDAAGKQAIIIGKGWKGHGRSR